MTFIRIGFLFLSNKPVDGGLNSYSVQRLLWKFRLPAIVLVRVNPVLLGYLFAVPALPNTCLTIVNFSSGFKCRLFILVM